MVTEADVEYYKDEFHFNAYSDELYLKIKEIIELENKKSDCDKEFIEKCKDYLQCTKYLRKGDLYSYIEYRFPGFENLKFCSPMVMEELENVLVFVQEYTSKLDKEYVDKIHEYIENCKKIDKYKSAKNLLFAYIFFILLIIGVVALVPVIKSVLFKIIVVAIGVVGAFFFVSISFYFYNYLKNIREIKAYFNQNKYRNSKYRFNVEPDDCRYDMSVPLAKHPLNEKDDEVKNKYLSIFNHYCDVYSNKSDVSIQMQRVYNDYFNFKENNSELTSKECKQMFRFLKRNHLDQVLVFDLLYINAYENEMYGRLIGESIKPYVVFSSRSKIDCLINGMFSYDENEKYEYPDMIKCWIANHKKLAAKRTSILITATMSAGKSTLINALAGRVIVPSKNEACTAKEFQVINKPYYDEFVSLKYGTSYLLNVSKEKVDQLNDSSEEIVYLASYFDLLKDNECFFRIIDSPGVNAALHREHKEAFKKIFEKGEFDKIIYVINAENSGTSDDALHMKSVIDNLNGKDIVFVVNKIDSLESEDDSVEELIMHIREDICKLGISNPIICPISAKDGLLLKQVCSDTSLLNDKKTKRTVENILDKFTEDEFDLSRFYKYPYRISASNYKNVNENIISALNSTGLPSLENTLFGGISNG